MSSNGIVNIDEFDEIDLTDYKKTVQDNFERQVRCGISKSSDAYSDMSKVAKNSTVEFKYADY